MMPRTRSIASVESEIKKIETEITKLETQKGVLTDRLLKLQKQKQDYEAKQLMDAFHKSGKTMQELMTFFGGVDMPTMGAQKVLVQLL